MGCEGTCNAWFHFNCAGFTESEFKFLKRSKNVFYMCENCKITCQMVDQSSVTGEFPRIRENMDAIKELINAQVASKLNDIVKSVTQLKAEIIDSVFSKLDESSSAVMSKLDKSCSSMMSKLDESSSTATRPNADFTYATAAKRTSVVVKPKDPGQNVSSTKADLFRSVNPLETNVHVAKVKSIKSGGVVVSCTSKQEASKFQKLVEDAIGDKYNVKEAAKLSPRLRIVGLSQKFDEEQVVKYIRLQNDHLVTESSEIKCLNVTPVKRSQTTFQALIELDGKSYQSILSNQFLYVGYDSCKVFDGTEILRCFNCCGFNHVASHCKNKRICPRCTQDHEVKKCQSTALKCINCVNANKINNDVKYDHAAWDTSNCFVYKQKLEQFKSNTLNLR